MLLSTEASWFKKKKKKRQKSYACCICPTVTTIYFSSLTTQTDESELKCLSLDSPIRPPGAAYCRSLCSAYSETILEKMGLHISFPSWSLDTIPGRTSISWPTWRLHKETENLGECVNEIVDDGPKTLLITLSMVKITISNSISEVSPQWIWIETEDKIFWM